MEHSVRVPSIPSNIEFPDNLQGRIRFDAAHHHLEFRGFMSKSEYDQLLRLSQDVNYQNAIVKPFQFSTVPDAPQLRRCGHVLAILTIACLLLAAIVWWSLLRGPPINDNRTSSGCGPAALGWVPR